MIETRFKSVLFPCPQNFIDCCYMVLVHVHKHSLSNTFNVMTAWIAAAYLIRINISEISGKVGRQMSG